MLMVHSQPQILGLWFDKLSLNSWLVLLNPKCFGHVTWGIYPLSSDHWCRFTVQLFFLTSLELVCETSSEQMKLFGFRSDIICLKEIRVVSWFALCWCLALALMISLPSPQDFSWVSAPLRNHSQQGGCSVLTCSTSEIPLCYGSQIWVPEMQ